MKALRPKCNKNCVNKLFWSFFFFTAEADKNTSKAALFSRKFTGLMYVLLKACDKEGRQAFVVKKAAFQPDKIF